MELSDQVYTDIEDEKRFTKVMKKISKEKATGPLYLVTFPIYEYGILEIYSYDELLQHYYREMRKTKPLKVLGVSESRTGAKNVIRDILEDCLLQRGDLDVKQFFAERESL